ncbi:MAG: cupin domain-containing protein [Pseudomonadota bacterium]
MTGPVRLNALADAAGIAPDGIASRLPAEPDPPTPFSGLTVGFVQMAEAAPHNGERHPDGDEVLWIVSGSVRVVFDDNDWDDIALGPQQGLIVPAGAWHRVEIVEPAGIVYLTPGPNNEFRFE